MYARGGMYGTACFWRSLRAGASLWSPYCLFVDAKLLNRCGSGCKESHEAA